MEPPAPFINTEMRTNIPHQQSAQYYHVQQQPQQPFYQQRVEDNSRPSTPSTSSSSSSMPQQYVNQQQMPYSLPGPYAQQPATTINNNNSNNSTGNNPNGSLAPMPDVPPMFDMYNSVMNNTRIGNNAVVPRNGVDNRRQDRNIVKFAQEPRDVYNKLVTAEMKLHFSQMEKLNLLDTDRLDIMYTYQDTMFVDRKFLYTYLCSEYRKKYGELFELYESLEVYMSFVLLVLIYQSEISLKKACEGSNTNVQAPKVGKTTFKLRMFSRKRKAPTVTGEEPPLKLPLVEGEEQQQQQRPEQQQQQQDADVTQQQDASVVRDDHPFLKEPKYLAHKGLFNLGEMFKYCVPSEFAVMFCNASLGTVNVFTQGDNKTPFKGVRVAFSRPVVSLVRSRAVKAYHYQSFDLYGLLGEYMTDITGSSVDKEAFKLNSMKQMKMRDIVTQCEQSPVNWEEGVGFHLALVSFFNCTDTEAGVLNNRTYNSLVYFIPKSHVDASDVGDLTCNNQTYDRRAEELNDYYDRIEGPQDPKTETTAATEETAH